MSSTRTPPLGGAPTARAVAAAAVGATCAPYSADDNYGRAVCDDGPLSFWRFDEPDTATTAIDQVGLSPGQYLAGTERPEGKNKATNPGIGSVTGGRTGALGKSIRMNGTEGPGSGGVFIGLNSPNNAATRRLRPPDGITIEAWILPRDSNRTNVIARSRWFGWTLSLGPTTTIPDPYDNTKTVTGRPVLGDVSPPSGGGGSVNSGVPSTTAVNDPDPSFRRVRADVIRNTPPGETQVWHHVVFTVSQNRLAVFIDGVLAAVANTGPYTPIFYDYFTGPEITQTGTSPYAYGGGIGIGRDGDFPYGALYPFDGRIDEVAVYSGALGPFNVVRHYTAAYNCVSSAITTPNNPDKLTGASIGLSFYVKATDVCSAKAAGVLVAKQMAAAPPDTNTSVNLLFGGMTPTNTDPTQPVDTATGRWLLTNFQTNSRRDFFSPVLAARTYTSDFLAGWALESRTTSSRIEVGLAVNSGTANLVRRSCPGNRKGHYCAGVVWRRVVQGANADVGSLPPSLRTRITVIGAYSVENSQCPGGGLGGGTVTEIQTFNCADAVSAFYDGYGGSLLYVGDCGTCPAQDAFLSIPGAAGQPNTFRRDQWRAVEDRYGTVSYGRQRKADLVAPSYCADRPQTTSAFCNDSIIRTGFGANIYYNLMFNRSKIIMAELYNGRQATAYALFTWYWANQRAKVPATARWQGTLNQGGVCGTNGVGSTIQRTGCAANDANGNGGDDLTAIRALPIFRNKLNAIGLGAYLRYWGSDLRYFPESQ